MKRKLINWFNSISSREQMIVVLTTIAVLIYGIYMPLSYLDTKISDNQRLLNIRKQDLLEMSQIKKRYNFLNSKLAKLEADFENLPDSYEPVTQELDSIIKNSTENTEYNLRKSLSPAAFGENFEQQNYTLEIKSLNLEQTSKLLFQMDRSKNAIFTGNVDISSSPTKGKFNIALDVIAVRKKPV